MEKRQAIEFLEYLRQDRNLERTIYGDALNMAIEALRAQPSKEDTTSDLISKFIDGLEEIFAHIRERHVDDSVCGLCEYDGAYMGQSGDWCNECPGFDRDDCFKLSDETRRKWTAEIIKALPPAQLEPTRIIPETRAIPSDDDRVSLSERVTATYYDDEYEEWSQRTVTVRDVLDAVCDEYTVLPTIQPEPSIPLSWVEKYIEWLKSLDNEFANLAAAHISVMLKKWRSEQNETD